MNVFPLSSGAASQVKLTFLTSGHPEDAGTKWNSARLTVQRMLWQDSYWLF
jgi:hypothetical protein